MAADRSACRPKPVKLATNEALKRYVQDRLAGMIVAGRHAPWVLTNCIRVMSRKTSRNPSGAQTIVFWIICRATRRAATTVLRHALRTRRDAKALSKNRRGGP